MSTVIDFPHRRAGHCGSGALRDLLEHRGLNYGSGPLPEGVAFGLAGGLGFLYLEIPEADPPIYLVGRTGDLERDIATNLGFGLEVVSTDDEQEGWSLVRNEVDAGRPPMVWADIMHLDYLRVRMHNTRHDIVVVGYDEDAGIAYIADNDRDEIQCCSLESLARARNSAAFPGPNRHTTFLYDWPDRLPDPRRAVAAGLRRAIANMTDDDGRPLAGLSGAPGLAGVDRFVSAYAGWPGRLGERLPDALRALRVFIVKAGTGGAMFRSLHAEFLRYFADLLNDPGLAATARTYEELAAAWQRLADAVSDEDHAAGVAVVLEIRDLEHAGVDLAEGWLGAQP
ncbi:MAG TPA: BtrH N-terminal domain-containing protein [Thermoleophilaceae bacterium]|nr:BtrH N-terminal domain-containing protein [Thermoleophilaceae bacterium]